MPEALEIALTPERLDDDATPEERVCFGRFTIEAAWGPLTAGIDHFIRGYRAGPLVSGYHAAEWFAWNWWRLRYEPRSPAPEWWRAHTMTAIGEGYAWPNLTIFSDGERTVLLSEPSVRPDAKPFRYLGAHTLVLPSAAFEAAVDSFVGQMEGRLFEHTIQDTNLTRVWAELRAERADPAQAERRRLEALLARDPDEHDDSAVATLVADALTLGARNADELAAEAGHGGVLLHSAALRELARSGTSSRSADAVALRLDQELPRWGDVPAHVVGARAAEALRVQEGLGDRPIDDVRLAALAGTQAGLPRWSASPFAFALDAGPDTAVVLRAKHPIGRRFELARLIGDRIAGPAEGVLYPATQALTYRQKMQRSFAAELLSPFAAVEEFLDGDLSAEAQEEAAAHFQVSPLTIRTLLVNHRRLDREELDAAA